MLNVWVCLCFSLPVSLQGLIVCTRCFLSLALSFSGYINTYTYTSNQLLWFDTSVVPDPKDEVVPEESHVPMPGNQLDLD